MIDPLVRQEIRYRHSLGESERSIAQVLGISRNTVHAYLIDETRGMLIHAPARRKSILHQAKQDQLQYLFNAVGGNCVVVARILQDDPQAYGLPKDLSITERSVRRFFATHYPNLRSKPKPAFEPFHCYPGQQLQIDFIQAQFQFDGELIAQKIYLFEAVYRWSRKGFVFVCPDTSQASWLMGIATCLMRYGLPQQILCDNDKSLVISHRRDGKVQFHPDFLWLCEPLGIRPQACRPNRPQTKGAVERFGRYVKENALVYLSIHNEGIRNAHDLQHRLDQWIEQQADQRRANGKSIEELFEIERAHLTHNPDISAYMNIASLSQLSSLNGEVVIFGYCISIPKLYANRLLTIMVRHNGEYRISTPEGLEVKSGAIPLDYLQRNTMHAHATEKLPTPRQDFDPMSDLRELDI